MGIPQVLRRFHSACENLAGQLVTNRSTRKRNPKIGFHGNSHFTGIETLETRLLLSGDGINVSGQVFEDLDGNGVKNAGEGGLAGLEVFVDANQNGSLDAGESSVLTDANGNYTFVDLFAGDYTISVVPQTGWSQSRPFELTGTTKLGATSTEADGQSPGTVVVADVNNDGNQDVLFSAPENSVRVVSVLLGDGTGGYTDGGSYNTDSANNLIPEAIIPTDLNADGATDLAVLVPGATTGIRILLNDGSGAFLAPVTYSSSSQFPTDMTSGDFDGDGDTDLAVSNRYTSDVTIFPNNNDGTFGTATSFTVGTDEQLLSITAADFDGDNDVDLAVGRAVNIVDILLNDGTGSFSQSAGTTVGSFPETLISSDLDGDGDFDLVARNSGSDNLSVLLSNGNGTFASAANYVVDANPSDLVVADLNDDALPELIVASHDTDSVSVLPNSGNGTFGTAVTVATGADPSYLAFGDVDGDEDIDIVAANSAGQNLTIIPNVTDRNAIAHQLTVTSGDTVADVDFGLFESGTIEGTAFEDSNGNGSQDAGEPGLSGWVLFLDSNGNGTLDSSESSVTTDPNGNYAFTGLAAGTYTIAEVVQSGWAQSAPGGPSFAHTISVNSGETISNVDFGNLQSGSITGTAFLDLDLDQQQDANEDPLDGWTVYIDANGNGSLDVDEASAQTDGTGSYSLTDLLPGTYTVALVVPTGWGQSLPGGPGFTHSITVASGESATDVNFGNFELVSISGVKYEDVNGNGVRDAGEAGLANWEIYLDANASGSWDSGETIATTGADGTYTFTELVPDDYIVNEIMQAGFTQTAPGALAFVPAGAYATGGPQPNRVTVGDIDADGNLDLAVTNLSFNTVGILAGRGNGSFEPVTSINSGNWPADVVIGDLDADGVVDIASVSFLGSSVSVFLGDGTGGFATPVTFSSQGTGPRSIEVGDVDGDGDPDLIVGNAISDAVAVFTNNGIGTFSSGITYSAGSRPRDISLTDIDGDTDLDIVTADYRGDSISVLLNNGNGVFGPATTIASGDGTVGVATGDIDGDGDADVIATNAYDNDISVFVNDGSGGFGTPTQYAAGTLPQSVIMADIDGDGDLDIAAANKNSDNVSVLVNQGNGAFDSAGAVAAGDAPVGINFGDFDQDGDIDLVVTNDTTSTVSIIQNTAATGITGAHQVRLNSGDSADGVDFGNTAGPPNTDPQAGDDALSTTVNASVNFTAADLLANDSDADNDTITLTGVSTPGNGTVQDNGNGNYTYTPATGFLGDDTFTYTIEDGNGGTASATVTVSVTNRDPVAGDDALSTTVNAALTFNAGDLTANDSDPDSDSLTIGSIAQPQPTNGTLVTNPDGSYTYTPANNFVGDDTFTYSISDGNGGTATATVTVTVANQNPTAGNDDVTTRVNHDLTINASDLLSNDSDPDGSTLSISSVAQPASGSLADNQDGTYTYTPNSGFVGNDSFTYVASDGLGGTATGTVNISVTNDNPVAGDDSADTLLDTAVTIDQATLLSNDTDADNDTLTISGFTQPSSGNVVDNGAGGFTYTPNAGFAGSDSFTYTVSDGNGGTATATVSITVSYPNLAVNQTASQSSDFLGRTADLAVDGNTDGDFNVGSVSGTNSEANPWWQVELAEVSQIEQINVWNRTDAGSANLSDFDIFVSLLPFASNDPAALRGDANVQTFNVTGEAGTPSEVVIGTLGKFVRLQLSTTAQLTLAEVEVLGVEQPNANPVATDDAVSTPLNTDVVINVADLLANDTDPDNDTLSLLNFAQGTSGSVTDNGNGTLTYSPNTDSFGQDSFGYTITDGKGGTASGTVDVTVELPNLALNQNATQKNDFDANHTAANAVDGNTDGHFVTGSVASTASTIYPHWDVQLEFRSPLIDQIQLWNRTDAAGDRLNNFSVFVSDAPFVSRNLDEVRNQQGVGEFHFAGTAGATEVVDIGRSGRFVRVQIDSASATYLTLAEVEVFGLPGVNADPVAADDSATTDQDTAVTIQHADLLSNDSDPDLHTLSITTIGNASNGTAVNNGDGTITYTPNAGYFGSDSFTYDISDGNGGTATGTVNIQVNEVVGEQNVAEGKPASQSSDLNLGSFVATADRAVDGSTDGNIFGGSVSTTQNNANAWWEVNLEALHDISTINVWNRTDASPERLDDFFVLVSNAPFVSTDLNAVLNQPGVGAYEITDIAGTPTEVTVNRKGQYVRVQFNKADYLSLAEVEVFGEASTSTNVAPVAQDDTATTSSDTAVTIPIADLLSNDSDADNDFIQITSLSTPGNGTVVNNNDGTLTYTPNGGFSGDDTFVYTLSDGTDTDTATVTVTVTGQTGTNVAANGTATQSTTLLADTSADRAIDGNTDGDFGNRSLSITKNTANPWWQVDLEAIHDIQTVRVWNRTDAGTDWLSDFKVFVSNDPFVSGDITEVTNQAGVHTFDVVGQAGRPSEIAVGQAGRYVRVQLTTTQYLNIAEVEVIGTLASGNIAPVAVDDSASTSTNTPVTLNASDLLSNDTDANSDTLSITAYGTASNGTVQDNGDGTVTYTPAQDFTGSDSFDYTVADGNGGTDTGTVAVEVTSAGTIENVALNKPAIQSSTLISSTTADKVVDGNTDGTFGGGSINVTKNQANAWWQVNLESVHNIQTINIYNRTDAGTEWLQDYDVIVSDSPLGTGIIDVGDLPGGITAYHQTAIAGSPTEVSIGRSGQYVRIQHRATQYLNMAEVEVMALTSGGSNSAPVAADDAVAANANAANSISAASLLANDQDADNDTLSIESVTQPSNGSLQDNGDGTYTYTPTQDFTGSDSFTYTVVDGNGGSDTATVAVNVTDGATLQNVALNKPANQSSTLLGTTGADKVVDGNTDGTFGGGSINVTKNQANAWWQVDLESLHTIETIRIFNRTDAGSDWLSDYDVIVSTTSLGNGVVDVNNLPAGATNFHQVAQAGSPTELSVNTSGRYVRVQLRNTNYLNMGEVEVLARVGGGGNSDPVAEADSVTTDMNQSTVISASSLLANDTDADSDTLSITGYGTATSGTVTDNGDGTVTYAPNQDFTGSDSFTYTVSDGNGGTATGTVNVSVVDSNTLQNVALGKTATQSSTLLNDTGADRAIDGDTSGQFADRSIAITNRVSGVDSWWQVDLEQSYSIQTINVWNRADAGVDWLQNFYVFVSSTPFVSGSLSDVRGQSGVQEFFVSDIGGRPTEVSIGGTGRYVRVQLNTSQYLNLSEVEVMAGSGTGGQNSAPTATDDTIAADMSTARTFDVSTLTGNDTDPDGDALTISSFGTPANGTVTNNGDGTFTYEPNAGFTGNDTFDYTISDGNSNSDTGTATVVVSDPSAVSNVAVGKSSIQVNNLISTSTADKANDGNTDGSFTAGSVTATKDTNNAWWQVNLGSSFDIARIMVWNRTDAAPERLQDFNVIVSSDPFDSFVLSDTLNQVGVTSYHVSGIGGSPTEIAVGRAGQYVRIQLNGSNFLSLAEVQVIGAAAAPAPAPLESNFVIDLDEDDTEEGTSSDINDLLAANLTTDTDGQVQIV